MQTLPLLPAQLSVCEKYAARPQLSLQHDRLGIALDTLSLQPVNGLRLPAQRGSSGWFIYGGVAPLDKPDFYQPLCVAHLRKYCEIALPYLCLPAGWRFQIDDQGYEDVWFDAELLK
jgi:hypothetical protein